MGYFLSLVGFAISRASAPEAEKPEGLPLEVAEVLEFEVDEGTWMSLDVSPDDQVWPVKKPLPKQFWWNDVPTLASTTHGGAP